MTKQKEALRMAIEAMDWELGGEPLPTLMIEARKACKEALEQPAKEQLTDSQCDEFRRLPMSFNDMVRAIYKAGQEALEQPAHDSDCAVHNAPAYPIGECDCKQPADGIELEWYCKGWDDAEKDLATQEPVLVNATTHDGQTYKIEVSAPSREWVGLSDDEIEEGFKEGWVTKQAFESSVWWAEAKLKEKNNGT